MLPAFLLLLLVNAVRAVASSWPSPPSLVLFTVDAEPASREFKVANIKLTGTLGYKWEYSLAKEPRFLTWPSNNLRSLSLIYVDAYSRECKQLQDSERSVPGASDTQTSFIVVSARLQHNAIITEKHQLKEMCQFVNLLFLDNQYSSACEDYNAYSTNANEYLASHVSKAVRMTDIYGSPMMQLNSSTSSSSNTIETFTWHINVLQHLNGLRTPKNLTRVLRPHRSIPVIEGRIWATCQLVVDMEYTSLSSLEMSSATDEIRIGVQESVIDVTQDEGIQQAVSADQLVDYFGNLYMETPYLKESRAVSKVFGDKHQPRQLLRYIFPQGFLDSLSSVSVPSHIEVDMEIQPVSFHPTANYHLRVMSEFKMTNKCQYYLYQYLPASFFYDPYQLRSSKTIQRQLGRLLNDPNETEKIRHLSVFGEIELEHPVTSINVKNMLAIIALQVSEYNANSLSVSLPFHVRYHLPMKPTSTSKLRTGNYVAVQLPPPLLLTSCAIPRSIRFPLGLLASHFSPHEVQELYILTWHVNNVTASTADTCPSAPGHACIHIPVGNTRIQGEVHQTTRGFSWVGCIIATYIVLWKIRSPIWRAKHRAVKIKKN